MSLYAQFHAENSIKKKTEKNKINKRKKKDVSHCREYRSAELVSIGRQKK